MPWTTPRTWVAGEILTASNMNTHVRDNTSWLGTDKPHCRVRNSAALLIANTTTTALTFDTEDFDVGAMHSTVTSTDRITVPTGGAGAYLCGMGVDWATNSAGYRQIFIRTNGTTTIVAEALPVTTAAAICHQVIVTIASLAVGDYIQMIVNQSSGGNLNVLSSAAWTPVAWAAWYST